MNKIYLISPSILDKKFFFYLPKLLSTKKIKFLQIRCKRYSNTILEKHLKKIIKITEKYNVKLIINDKAFLSLKFKNLGFHLGQNDLLKEKNLTILKNTTKYFGITCHNSLTLAYKAKKIGAKYIALGAFSKTQTKKVKYKASLSTLKNAKKLKIKIVAIGGINADNYKTLLKGGANYLAVSGFIWKNNQLSPLQAIKLFK